MRSSATILILSARICNYGPRITSPNHSHHTVPYLITVSEAILCLLLALEQKLLTYGAKYWIWERDCKAPRLGFLKLLLCLQLNLQPEGRKRDRQFQITINLVATINIGALLEFLQWASFPLCTNCCLLHSWPVFEPQNILKPEWNELHWLLIPSGLECSDLIDWIYISLCVSLIQSLKPRHDSHFGKMLWIVGGVEGICRTVHFRLWTQPWTIMLPRVLCAPQLHVQAFGMAVRWHPWEMVQR